MRSQRQLECITTQSSYTRMSPLVRNMPTSYGFLQPSYNITYCPSNGYPFRPASVPFSVSAPIPTPKPSIYECPKNQTSTRNTSAKKHSPIAEPVIITRSHTSSDNVSSETHTIATLIHNKIFVGSLTPSVC